VGEQAASSAVLSIPTPPIGLPDKVTRLLAGEPLLPGVVNPLDNGAFEIRSGQKIRHSAAMTKGINGPAHFWCNIQVVFQPLMTLDELIQHGVYMHIGLIRHHPSAGGDFNPTGVNQSLQGSLLGGMRLIPPELQEADLRPDEGHVRVLLHLRDQQIEDLP